MTTLVIQAGGASSRMGEDKALLPFLGQPLISRVIARLSPAVDHVMVITNQPESYDFLGLPIFPDLLPGQGPLGGLFTALNVVDTPLVAVVACDMPFANPRLLEAGIRWLHRHPKDDVVLPRSSNGLEPLHGLYRVSTCLEPVQKALAAGERRMISWLHEVSLKIISIAQVIALDPGELAFWNLNTPEDFRQAEDLAQKIG